ncbi:MAG: imidazoleglycerol-phosphate dehydratase HisB [Dehalococcoidales bacterium]|jgi:imidazoleglycerol-phosphate dehydratase
MDAAESVLLKIIRLQNREGYSDQQMADKIGCSRPLYQRTRTEKIPVGGTFLKGAMALLSEEVREGRRSAVKRDTRETNITLELNVDGTGKYTIATGVKMLDHFLSQMARHGLFDIKLFASGDDVHHIVEDVGICLGKAFGEALGEKRGIVRMAGASIPMDETLVSMAVDISGRAYSVLNLDFSGDAILDLPTELVKHFFESFANEAKINLHASIVYGANDHHKAEALFKAFGRVLDAATRIDERIAGELPTTKEYLQR